MSISKYNDTKKIKKIVRKLSILFIINLMILNVFNSVSFAENPYSPITIESVISPESAIERDIIKIKVIIKNNGTENITSQNINVYLYIDDDWSNLSAYNCTNNLDINEIKSVNLSWKTELVNNTQRKLNIKVEYANYTTFMDKYIDILERGTDLTFYDNMDVKGHAYVNKTISLNAIVENIGTDTNEEINASLFIDGVYNQRVVIDGLSKDERYNLSFDWTPDKYGKMIANISLDKNKIIDEYDDTNNFCEMPIFVEATRFDWWNPNWHYRKSFLTNGSGNISINLNFTQILKNLGIINKIFENDTIVVVKYSESGEPIEVINKTNFNESLNFNAEDNATGILSWYAENAYYSVYFDVEINLGIRTKTEEIKDLNLTNQNISLEFSSYEEGWWSEWSDEMDPLKDYYFPYGSSGITGDEMDLKIETNAFCYIVKAKFVRDYTHFTNLTLVSLDWLFWEGKIQFTEIGNYNLTIITVDRAGYQNTELIHDFYVGYPDLTIDSINVSSESYKYGTYYEGTEISIKANILAFNTTVYNVNISLVLDDILVEYKYVDIEKDKQNIVDFFWSFEDIGKHNIIIFVDDNNLINESNENNNSIQKNIKIEGKPDIGVISMEIPSSAIYEGEQAVIHLKLNNYGIGNATHYRINLYFEQNDENNDGILDETMNFKSEKNHTYIDLKINKTKNITLIWDDVEYGDFKGEWIVGAKVITNLSYPDSDKDNNDISSLPKHFKVIATTPHEKNKPIIKLIYPDLSEKFEQGDIIEIRSKITDDSGIKKVEIEITDPEGKKYTNSMENDGDNEYFYLFYDTDILGEYYFNITALDISVYENAAELEGNFLVIEDGSPPYIKSIRVLPSKQLKNKIVKIKCEATDTSGIRFINLTIKYPDGSSETKNMEKSSIENIYFYENSYKIFGKYTCFISIEDKVGNKIDTKDKLNEFWITNDLNDTDSDGMPDWWEEKYGFNPYNSADAIEDKDDDGFDNAKEFELGTNPLKPVTLNERFFIKLSENWLYLLTSVILFLVLIALSFYGFRREAL